MTVKREKKIQAGSGSDKRPVLGTLWAADSRPDHIALKATGNIMPDNLQVEYRRYHEKKWAEREFETVFSRTWLFVCREEDLPDIGDRLPFQIGPKSAFIIRIGDDEFKAFYNACLHRATTLCSRPESGDFIKCPYHGWEWQLDGKLQRIPSHWDFTHINRQNGSLPEVALERWGGFIFINLDPDCAPLEEALQVLPEHFEQFDPASRYTAARFRKLVNANWKIAQEAFMESYHLYATHPEAVEFSGDTQTQYDIWLAENGCVGRNASPGAVPSMHAADEYSMLSASEKFAAAMKDWHYPDVPLPEFDADRDPRKQLADWHRDAIEATYGFRSELPDAMMIDSILYFMFPHFGIWLCETLPFTYQFMPHPTDPGKSYFDVRMLLPCPKNKPRPPAAPAIEIGPDESIFEKSEGFSFLAYVFDQDMSNMPLIQRGVTATSPQRSHTELGSYQEILVQQWNQLIDQFVR